MANLDALQAATLAVDIAADPTLGALSHTVDNSFVVADAYNLLASPDFIVWRTDISNADVIGVLDWTEMLTLSPVQLQVFNIMLLPVGGTQDGKFDASDPNIRNGIMDIFAGPLRANTRDALTILGKRLASRLEVLFAIGTGSDASPGTMEVEGLLTARDVQRAWGI